MQIKEEIRRLAAAAEDECAAQFKEIDETARFNQEKVLDAFISG